MGLNTIQDWQGNRLGPIVVLDRVDSTNAELLRRAQKGIVEAGTVLVAKEQTAGRGRRRRPWWTAGGDSVALSVYWHCAKPGLPQALFTTWGAVAADETLLTLGVRGIAVKWPNDILIRGKKVCGILAEALTTGNATDVALGIGVNVGQSVADWPPNLRSTATSLAAAAPGQAAGVEEVVTGLLTALDHWWDRTLKEGPEPLHERWVERLGLLAGPVEVHTDAGVQKGTIRAFHPDGSLDFDDGSGRRTHLASGSVKAIQRDPGDSST